MISRATLFLLLASCSSGTVGKGPEDCTQAGECPKGLRCFPDWRCYAPDADPGCRPACYGAEPLCHRPSLRCVECLADSDCPSGTLCSAAVLRCQPGCSAAHPTCATKAEKCDLALGVCRGCTTDAECTAAAPHCDVAAGRCEVCVTDSDCPAAHHCGGASGARACSPGCTSKLDCTLDGGAASIDCCGHRCVDTATDPKHCGACGTGCGGNTCCAGTCADLTKDLEHCGTCGHTCALPGVAGPTCTASTCFDLGCEFYFGDCDGNKANGCETNLSYTAAHCSVCGNACAAYPHAQPACVLASCGFGACLAGWGDCNQIASDGCEASLATNARCGSCTRACVAPATCVSGQCL